MARKMAAAPATPSCRLVVRNRRRGRLQCAPERVGYPDPTAKTRQGPCSRGDRRHREPMGRTDAGAITGYDGVIRYMSASRSLALFTATLQSVTAMIKTTDLQQLINRLKHESEAAKALMIEYGLMPRKNRNSARPV